MGETLMPAVQIEEELLERARQAPGGARSRTRLERRFLPGQSGNVKSEIVRVARERRV